MSKTTTSSSPIAEALNDRTRMPAKLRRRLPLAGLGVISALALVACGGGTDPETGTLPNAPGTGSVAIQTTVPEPPLAAGTGKRIALDYMNRQRLQCGFGALRYNTVLETTGYRHAVYNQANQSHPLYHPHTEVKGLPGYTAPSPTERALLAGYVTNGVEVGEIGTSLTLSAPVETYRAYPLHLLDVLDMRKLSVAPYHAIAFFSAFTEVGIGDVRNEEVLPPGQTMFNGVPIYRLESIALNRSFFVMLGYGKDGQGQLPPPGAGVRTYPCEGSTDVQPLMNGEWTDPALGPGVTPGRNLGVNPTGTTIMVIGEVGKTLALQSVALTRVLTGESIAMYSIRTRANDPMAVYYRNDWTGYAMPDKALVPNERYHAHVSGNSGGVPFTRSFTFTTGGRDPLRPAD